MVREFTVAVFVVHDGKVLLHWHHKLQRWLPPGGHIEPGELPDEAAVRETAEEAGLVVEVIDAVPAPIPLLAEGPRRLAQPLGIQLENIAPGHQHIDLIYVARVCAGGESTPRAAADDPESRPGWFAFAELDGLGVDEEVAGWARAALAAAGRR